MVTIAVTIKIFFQIAGAEVKIKLSLYCGTRAKWAALFQSNEVSHIREFINCIFNKRADNPIPIAYTLLALKRFI
jgi:hypothetical protein